jgi:hypothetical protein
MVRLLKKVQGTVMVNKLSIGTVSLCYIEDTFETTLRIFTYMEEGHFELFIPPLILLIIYLLFLAKLLGLIWIDNYGNELADPRTRTRYFVCSMGVLVLTSVVYQLFLYNLPRNLFTLLLPVLGVYLQVLYNSIKGNNPGF